MPGLFDRLLNRKPKTDAPRSDSGRAHYGGFLDEDELNNELRGREGLRIFDKMYRGDHDIRRNVAMAANPLVGATWSMEPHGGDDATDEDRQIADDCAWALGLGDYVANTPNRTPWASHLAEFLPVLIRSGFCPGELEWTSAKREDGRRLITLRRIGLRLPRSIWRWITDPKDLDGPASATGNPIGTQNADELLALEQYRASHGDYVKLQRQDLVYYRLGVEGDNWEGISLLRPVYKAWFIKDKIERLDAMGIEREAIGLPVAYPPKGGAQSAEVMTDLEGKLALLRQGALAYLIMPGPKAEVDAETGWSFEIMGLGGEGGGGKRDAQPSLQYWRDAISTAFVQEFMRLGQGGGGSKGALSTAEVQDDPFTLSITAMAAPIIAEITQLVLRRFVNLNYGPDKPLPQLTMSTSEGDLAALVGYVGGLVAAELIHPDDPLEDFLRQRGKLPPADQAARDQRKQQEADQAQAELDTQKAGLQPQPGANGSEKTTTKQRLPAGGERVKETVKHLDDAPASAGSRDAGALQITTPVLGHKCEHCDGDHASDGCPKRLAAEPRDWERVMPLEQLAEHMDTAAQAVHDAAAPHLTDLADRAARAAQQGQDGPQDPPQQLVDDITATLVAARAYGYATVGAELAAQHQPGTRVLGVPADVVITLAGELPKDPIVKRAMLIGRAIVQAITASVQGRHLDGITSTDTLIAAGAQAGDTAATFQGRGAAAAAVNQGRDDAALDFGHMIQGARYTSILDKNRCEVCAHADDGVLRTLDDPKRKANRPPNPACKSVLSGINRCRCLEFYELNDEAPANLDTGELAAYLLYDPTQPRDHSGKWAKTPHPSALEHVSPLGGSTGATLQKDQAGNLYVVKQGSHRRHLLEEDAADRIYRAAGARVPDSQVHPTPGGPVKVARYLTGGRTLRHQDADQRASSHAQLREHFALDATMANWDVIGLARDNAMSTPDGTAYRIDNGGALRFRAHGQPKTTVAAHPTELWSMREHGPGRDVYGGMPWSQVMGQAHGLLDQREQLLAAAPGGGQRSFLRARLDGLQQIVSLHDQGWPESVIRTHVGYRPAEHLLTDHADPGMVLGVDDDEQVYTLAKGPFTPAEHPRDPDGRFIVKIGDIALNVLQGHGAKHGLITRGAGKAFTHKTTTSHTATKNGTAFTVTQHDVHAHEPELEDLHSLVTHAIASGAHKNAPNSSAAKQGLARAQLKLTQALEAAKALKTKGGDPAEALKAAGAKIQPAAKPKTPKAPAKPKPAKKLTPAQLAAKLEQDGKPPVGNFESLPKGTVFQDLQTNLAVLDPDTPAFTGYVTGHVIHGPKTGGKVEVPKAKKPAKVLLPTQAEGAMEHVAAGSAGAAPKAPGAPATSSKPAKAGPVMFGGHEPPAKFQGVPTDLEAEKLWTSWQADTKAKLTGPEISALSSYTDGEYSTINGQLRAGEHAGDLNVAQKAARIDSAISKASPSKQPTVLSRKTTLPTWKAGAKPGTVIQDNGFLSTSTWGGTWDGDVHLKILVPAGARGLFVNTTGGSMHANEKEVILPRGAQFIVHERQETGGSTILFVELIV